MDTKQIRFSQSARKHRIGKSHAMWAINHVEATKVLAAKGSGKADRLMWIGYDDRGVELEIIAVDLYDMILVIHVMPRNFRKG